MACPATGANRDLAIVRENVFKTTPATPFFKYLRTTGDSLVGTTDTQTSNELRKGRKTSAPVKGRSSSSGDVSIELSYRSFDELLAALMFNYWAPNTELTYQDGDTATPTVAAVPGQRKLTLGNISQSFSVMRYFSDKGLYRFYRGVSVGGFNLSVPLDGKVSGSFNLMGANNPRMLNYAVPADAAVIDAMGMSFDPETPHRTDQINSFVGTLKSIIVETNTGEDVSYATQLDLSINNNLNQDFALFDSEAICVSPQQFSVTGTVTLYLTDEKHINAFIDWTTLKIVFILEDPAGNRFQIRLSEIKLTAAPDGVSGAGSITIAQPFTAFGDNAIDIICCPVTAEHRFLAPALTETADGFTLAAHPDYTSPAWALMYPTGVPAGHSMEYSLDNGTTWTPYAGAVTGLTGAQHIMWRAPAAAPFAASVVAELDVTYP